MLAVACSKSKPRPLAMSAAPTDSRGLWNGEPHIGEAAQENACTASPKDTENNLQLNQFEVDQRGYFKHTGIDRTKPSIRLIKILPELSHSGEHIQCTIRHATIDIAYTCLSYVWGAEADGHWIILDGEFFWVRENLWQFLQQARRKPHICNEWLWIDALCIDQANSNERTHQVQHMGSILSKATNVIWWLGMSPAISEYLADPPASDIYELRDSFNGCEYWKRTWITQEVCLARHITFMPKDVDCDEKKIAEARRRSCSTVDINLRPRPGNRLMDLLQVLTDKECSVPRDRIFSLLGVYKDTWFKVDYKCSNRDLMKNVLQVRSSATCICAVNVLAGALRLLRT
jgi:hypothetical protein